jgi:hypothetical protein
MSCMSPDLSNNLHMRELRDLYIVLSFLDELTAKTTPLVSLSDLVAFRCGNLTFSVAQQEYLLSNERLLSEFQALAFGYTALQPSYTVHSDEDKRRYYNQISLI